MKKAFEFSRAVAGAIIAVAILAGVTHAEKTDPKKIAEASRDAQKAADAFTEIMNVPERAIPQSLLDKAEAIAVFPAVIKAGFIVGGGIAALGGLASGGRQRRGRRGLRRG